MTSVKIASILVFPPHKMLHNIKIYLFGHHDLDKYWIALKNSEKAQILSEKFDIHFFYFKISHKINEQLYYYRPTSP